MPCATCHRLPAPPPSPAVLFQIEQGYSARWDGLELSVRLEMNQWTVRIRNAADPTPLYMAYRYNLNAARQSAADFAVLYSWGPGSRLNAVQLSSQLDWKKSN
jgi:hypothetical protein